jgi:hypothetical protein
MMVDGAEEGQLKGRSTFWRPTPQLWQDVVVPLASLQKQSESPRPEADLQRRDREKIRFGELVTRYKGKTKKAVTGVVA